MFILRQYIYIHIFPESKISITANIRPVLSLEYSLSVCYFSIHTALHSPDQ